MWVRTVLVVALATASACGVFQPRQDAGALSEADAGGATDGGGAGASGVTWHKDVNALVQQRCASCHVPGGIAPFSLKTYADAKPMASAMASAVAARRMPPWMPAEDCGGPFIGERRLSQAEIDTIRAWSTDGAPEGNPADARAVPDAGLTGLPRVDAELPMPEAYTPSATLDDDYRCFLVDPQLTAARSITGYDILPGVGAEVHHVIIYIVNKAQAVAKDAAEAGPGWQCFGGSGIADTGGAIGAWAPGVSAVVYPGGTGIPLPADKGLAMQIHYNTQAGVRVPDTTRLKLMYATGAVTPAYLIPLAASGFEVPPMTQNYSFTKPFPNSINLLPNIKLWGFLPHMHTKGVRISLRGPSNECLIDIPRWDFHWQGQYFRSSPFTLARGDAVNLSCTWNNPTTSPLRWGEGTDDEMCFAYVYATP